MKKLIFTLIFFILCFSGFSQNNKFSYNGRFTPVLKQEEIKAARYIGEIMPDFCGTFSIPFNDEAIASQLRLKYYRNSLNDLQPHPNYMDIVEFVSVNISGIRNGKVSAAESTSQLLTDEQRALLAYIDPGTDLTVKIKFKYKNQDRDNLNIGSKIREGTYRVAVLPEVEAEYVGGNKAFSDFINQNMLDKVSKADVNKIYNSTFSFTVNESGKISNGKIVRSSGDVAIDRMILDVISKMPSWKPAKNLYGIYVKETFSIAMGGGGC